MKGEQDYIRDISEMRSMMERSSKFLSLSGMAGIMAGIYALLGAYIAYKVFDFNPGQIAYNKVLESYRQAVADQYDGSVDRWWTPGPYFDL
jgi:predicted lysophospholipase L1 biosynthesis ABC-type transport system permease subunit